MTIEQDFAALRAAFGELRNEHESLRRSYEGLSDAYSALSDRHRTDSMALEDAVIAAIRAARVTVDGFAENFDSAFIARIRNQDQWEAQPFSGYFKEITRLADAIGCSDDVRSIPGA